MKWHCGLLSERPDNDRTLIWLKRGAWEHGLPPEIEHELRIWMAMPGFSIAYHAHTLRVGRTLVARNIGGYDAMQKEVAENWLSASREDCVRLARIRPNMGELPVISQLQVMNDLKAGGRPTELAREYQAGRETINVLGRGVIKSRRPLPVGFSLLSNSIAL